MGDPTNEILVICDTLKQANDLFDRYVKLLPGNSGFRVYKCRREIIFNYGMTTRFTSEKHYETKDRFGFRGKTLDGGLCDELLDSIEKSLEAWR